ncbi:contractile injection system tape measure protein [Tenacibaculum discolor]|uniref:contractile injection system tape measure protein n=1 Tax=Tenacibaculum discolor TaxID=361581 RepID=UPI000F5A9443|nr:contractile injection system tape measure protein [Tenacibaculum discolor]
MVAKEHTIQKVFVEVNTKSKKVAEECKNTIEDFLQEEVFPEIEKYFNSQEIEYEAYIQQIENLNIEVDISTNNKSIKDNSTKREIKEQLITKLKAIFKAPELHKVAIKKVTTSESKLDAFFHFLQHGTTAWWNQKEEKSFTKKMLFEITESQFFEERFLKSLRDPVQQNRLIQQFKTEELQILFLGVFNKPVGYETFLSTIKKIDFKSYIIRNKVWKFFIKATINNNFSRIVNEVQEEIEVCKRTKAFNSSKNLTQFLQELTSQERIFRSQFNSKEQKEFKKKEEGSSIEVVNTEFISKKEEKKSDVSIDKLDKVGVKKNQNKAEELTLPKNESSKSNSQKTPEKVDIQNKKEVLKKKKTSSKEKSKEVKEELRIKMQAKSKNLYEDKGVNLKTEKITDDQKRAEYKRRHQEALKNTFSSKNEVVSEPKSHLIRNAGLILLHPFLKQFFNSCGFLDKENKIIKPNEAVHLLHYVATKKEQQFENNLIFEKFLCNLPIQSSIERNIVLSDELKEKSEELLRAVLQNWSILKNSSNDLLRNEYLQREGKLDLTKDNPTLTVERKTQDILLDTKLPWNLSLCKLPWMKELIFTNW